MKFIDLLEAHRERDQIFDEIPLSKDERPPKSNSRAESQHDYYQRQRAGYLSYLDRLFERLLQYTPDDIIIAKQDQAKPTAPGWLLVGRGHFPRFNYRHNITETDRIYLWCRPDKNDGQLYKENAANPKALAAVEKYLRAQKKVSQTEASHSYYLGRIQREEEDKRRQRYANQRAAREKREIIAASRREAKEKAKRQFAK